MSIQLPPALEAFIQKSSIAISVGRRVNGDHPLFAVNKAFERLTGYSEDDVVGKDCRFLQGEDTDPIERRRLRRFLDDDKTDQVRSTILNYRKDGERFANLVFMARLHGVEGTEPLIFASQFDVGKATAVDLDSYETRLGSVTHALSPTVSDLSVVLNGTFLALANSASIIANARLKLSE